MHKEWFLIVWIIWDEVAPFSLWNPEIHLHLPDISWIDLFRSIDDEREVLLIVLRLDFDQSFISDETIWRSSDELIQFDESDLLNVAHVLERIDFSSLWLKFVSSLNVLIWIWFFLSRREEFSTDFLCVGLETFSDISDCLSMRASELSLSECEPFFWALLNVEMIFWSHSGKVMKWGNYIDFSLKVKWFYLQNDAKSQLSLYHWDDFSESSLASSRDGNSSDSRYSQFIRIDHQEYVSRASIDFTSTSL